MQDKFENICLFVADSLRWDYLPETLADRGVAFQTVAHSLYTPPSFTSLVTGLYPPQHGVYHWQNKLPEHVETLFDINSLNVAIHEEDSNKISMLFDSVRHEELENLSPPFVYLERDLSPHFPYTEDLPNRDYFKNRDWDTVEADYEASIHQSVSKFQRRVETLEQRGLLEETLLVFTSDHGELLGEYGDALHIAPACPELVQVPTVFIHSSLSADSFTVSQESDLIEHVDVVETMLSQQSNSFKFDTVGTDLCTTTPATDWGYNHVSVRRRNYDFYKADSLWWPDGGHVFTVNSPVNRLVYVLYRMLRSNQRFMLRRNVRQSFANYLPSSKTFDSPPVPQQEAREILKEFLETFETTESVNADLDKKTKQRLQELGYLN